MKRSEMLEIMTDAWYDYLELMTADYSGVGKGMDYVLNKMENAGMLPPDRSDPVFDDAPFCEWEIE